MIDLRGVSQLKIIEQNDGSARLYARVDSTFPPQRDDPSKLITLELATRLMWQTHGRPFELEGGATFRVDDRFRASWS